MGRENTYNDTIFVYNPFLIHPVDPWSILEAVDSSKERYPEKKYRKSCRYFLPRVFDDKRKYLDPISFEQNSLIAFDKDIPKDVLFFQTNHPNVSESKTGLIEITSENLIKFYKTQGRHEIFFGYLDALQKF